MGPTILNVNRRARIIDRLGAFAELFRLQEVLKTNGGVGQVEVVPSAGADNAEGDRMTQSEGTAEGKHEVADFHVVAVVHGRGDQIGSLDRQHTDVGFFVLQDTQRMEQEAVDQVDADGIGRCIAVDVPVGTAFQQSETAQPDVDILAVEEELRGPVVAGCPDILGRVDLIVDRGNSLVVSDWKTARNRWTAEQTEDAAEQLLLYAELAKDFAPGKPVKLEFVILTKAKEPVVDRHLLPVIPAQAERTKRVVENVWRAIDAEHFYPAPSAMNCPGCPYREECRAWRG
jgi:CRISPR/Cas system-associated exonuclease Cas4 (RecB family)